jgi:hypothetical protein
LEAVKVPQHLDLEDVVAFGLGASDLFFVVTGVALGWWLYLVMPEPLALRLGTAAPAATAGFALGVPRVGGRALREWVWIAAAYVLRPRVLVSGDMG